MNSANELQTKCITCGDPLKGRSDKKFCNDYCRSNYNNKLKYSHHKTVRNINNALAKNRRILESLLGNDSTKKVSREDIIQMGFIFKYFTQLYISGNGKNYYFCYDYGYTKIENDYLLIVKRKNE